jgi:hypothetical protein
MRPRARAGAVELLTVTTWAIAMLDEGVPVRQDQGLFLVVVT